MCVYKRRFNVFVLCLKSPQQIFLFTMNQGFLPLKNESLNLFLLIKILLHFKRVYPSASSWWSALSEHQFAAYRKCQLSTYLCFWAFAQLFPILFWKFSPHVRCFLYTSCLWILPACLRLRFFFLFVFSFWLVNQPSVFNPCVFPLLCQFVCFPQFVSVCVSCVPALCSPSVCGLFLVLYS